MLRNASDGSKKKKKAEEEKSIVGRLSLTDRLQYSYVAATHLWSLNSKKAYAALEITMMIRTAAAKQCV